MTESTQNKNIREVLSTARNSIDEIEKMLEETNRVLLKSIQAQARVGGQDWCEIIALEAEKLTGPLRQMRRKHLQDTIQWIHFAILDRHALSPGDGIAQYTPSSLELNSGHLNWKAIYEHYAHQLGNGDPDDDEVIENAVRTLLRCCKADTTARKPEHIRLSWQVRMSSSSISAGGPLRLSSSSLAKSKGIFKEIVRILATLNDGPVSPNELDAEIYGVLDGYLPWQPRAVYRIGRNAEVKTLKNSIQVFLPLPVWETALRKASEAPSNKTRL